MSGRAAPIDPGGMTKNSAANGLLRRRTVLAASAAGVVAAATGGTSVAAPADQPRRRFTGRFAYLRRADWGADESYRFDAAGNEIWPPAYYDVQTLTVHHTVTSNADANPAGTVQAIYHDQAVNEEFGDIGYHLLIDQAGAVYEGRYSGVDHVPVFGSRRVGPRPSMVNAAHVGGFNAGNIGVALLGDLTNVQPAPGARASLVRVLASLAHAVDLDPLGTTSYVNPISGATRTVPTIAGHRDWAPTECPGNSFYPFLAGVREDVAELLRG